MRLSYEDQIRGLTVVDSSGRAIGDVQSVFFDTESLPERLSVDSFRVRLRNEVADELGIAHGTFSHATIDVPAAALQGISDAVILRVPVRALAAADAPAPH